MDIVYVATGQSFFEMAVVSAMSVRKFHPSARIHIVSDKRHVDCGDFGFVELPGATFTHKDKIAGLQKIDLQKKFLFLDADTYVVGSLQPLFDVLDHFDVAAAISEVRVAPPRKGVSFDYLDISPAFPEFNSGVVAFNSSPAVKWLFQEWHREYLADVERGRGAGMPDQPSFRRALYRSPIRIGPVPPEYNCRLPFCGYYEAAVVVLHGNRTIDQFEALGRKLNGSLGPRIYFPKWFVIHQNNRLSQTVKEFRRTLLSLWK